MGREDGSDKHIDSCIRTVYCKEVLPVSFIPLVLLLLMLGLLALFHWLVWFCFFVIEAGRWSSQGLTSETFCGTSGDSDLDSLLGFAIKVAEELT